MSAPAMHHRWKHALATIICTNKFRAKACKPGFETKEASNAEYVESSLDLNYCNRKTNYMKTRMVSQLACRMTLHVLCKQDPHLRRVPYTNLTVSSQHSQLCGPKCKVKRCMHNELSSDTQHYAPRKDTGSLANVDGSCLKAVVLCPRCDCETAICSCMHSLGSKRQIGSCCLQCCS